MRDEYLLAATILIIIPVITSTISPTASFFLLLRRLGCRRAGRCHGAGHRLCYGILKQQPITLIPVLPLIACVYRLYFYKRTGIISNFQSQQHFQ
jgi:hypothetical protein